jgi:biotin carboxyl carrier protein
MELKLRIDDRTYAVSVPPSADDGPRRFVVDGAAHEVAAVAAEASAFTATLDGKKTVLHVMRAPEGTWVSCAGRTRLVRDAALEKRRSGRASGPGSGAVTPAFPSVVVALLVVVGEEVRKGQALVVISAMKMESRLVAPHAGRVRAIRASVGASVKPGDVLVEIEPAAGGTVDE